MPDTALDRARTRAPDGRFDRQHSVSESSYRRRGCAGPDWAIGAGTSQRADRCRSARAKKAHAMGGEMGRGRTRVAAVVATVAFVASGLVGVANAGIRRDQGHRSGDGRSRARLAARAARRLLPAPRRPGCVRDPDRPPDEQQQARDRRAHRRTRRVHERRDRHHVHHLRRRPRRRPERGSSCRRPELTLQPGEQRDVNFTVHVPPNAKPGQYLAGIGMWVPLPRRPRRRPSGNHAGFAITLQGERIIAAEIVVPGPREREARGARRAPGRVVGGRGPADRASPTPATR